MDLKEIAAVAGKPGLYMVIKPTRTGVILETLDEKRSRIVANANSRVSVLKEISVYTTDKEGSIPLSEALIRIHDKYGDKPEVDNNSNEAHLRTFIETVIPDYDKEKVYLSDIKKLVSWYHILAKFASETFKEIKAEKLKEEAALKAEKK